MRIFEANRDVLSDPSKVVPGMRLRIPPADSAPAAVEPARRAGPGASSERTYTVQSGDTLSRIARSQMGTSDWSAVQALAELNRQVVPDPDRLAPGTVLRIPR